MHALSSLSAHTGPSVNLFAGTPLPVVFAESDALDTIRERGEGVLTLTPPFHLADEDMYLVLPDDIGLELVDILKDGDLELLAETYRDGMLVIGDLAAGSGAPSLSVEFAAPLRELISRDAPFAAEVDINGDPDALDSLNAVDPLCVAVVSEFVDDKGLENLLGRDQYVGVTWSKEGGEPTCAWSRRSGDGVNVELALFQEYEELVAVFRPLRIHTAR